MLRRSYLENIGIDRSTLPEVAMVLRSAVVLLFLVLTHCLMSAVGAEEVDTQNRNPGIRKANRAADQRPNILWIVSEDHGPHLGCYGDSYATTPNVDRLAARGLIYTHVWSCAPVCAPARTTLISGLYANSTGSEHMRSMVPGPAGKALFPQLLRQAGYYCTNNSKEDYNLKPSGRVWDESSPRAHWSNRGAGQPFFAVFNSEKSHESQIRARPHTLIHNPAGVRVPAYHPDTPEVRHDWAQYYDGVTQADADAGRRLEELFRAGLSEETIIFYFADHGSGMPRSKRWPYDSGLHAPLVVYIPERFASLRPADYVPGGQSGRLISFVDFAPTVLSLAGVEPPKWHQGHAFLGHYAEPPQPFLFGFRGRMDERYDLVRSATDGRYVYVRNFMPHRIYGQRVAYMFETPTTQVWQRMHQEGKLNPVQDAFWNPKPTEELYDLTNDPDEVQNLIDSPDHREPLLRLRHALHEWMLKIRDVGLIPEGELYSRSNVEAPYDLGHDESKYPIEQILAVAELASSKNIDATGALLKALHDPNSAVRYWGAMGLLIRPVAGEGAEHDALVTALDDASPYVRIVAAESLARVETDRPRALQVLSESAGGKRKDLFEVMAALNSLDCLGNIAAPVKDTLRQSPPNVPLPNLRYFGSVQRLLEPVP